MLLKRLLEPAALAKAAPGLDATHLFALVVYKNFHLEDFEDTTRRDSDLDRLYDFAQRLVRENIAALNRRRRDLEAEEHRVRTRDQDAERMGEVLNHYAAMRLQMNNPWGWNVLRFAVGPKLFSPKDLSTYTFWSAVAQAQSLTVAVVNSETSTQARSVHTIDAGWLATFVPEALQAHRWAEFDEATAAQPLADVEDSVALLRRATFEDLVKAQRFKLVPTGDEAARLNPVPEPGHAQTFAELVQATVKSKLAAELVRRGYIDRNFSLYAAQFYGNFSGVDVATFMVQHVQPNVMSIDYDLSRPRVGNQEGAVANLLSEADDAGEELLETAAAWNIDIANYLLRTDEDCASIVVCQLIVSWPSKDANDFLSRYFTSENAGGASWRNSWPRAGGATCTPTWSATRGCHRRHAPSCSTPPWLGSTRTPPTTSTTVCSTTSPPTTPTWTSCRAISRSRTPAEVRGHDAEEPSERPLERVATLLHRADVTFAELGPLRPDVLERVVAGSHYRLTADNLRTALDLSGDASIAMEAVRADENVYEYCLISLPAYLSALDSDERTDHAVGTRNSSWPCCATSSSRLRMRRPQTP